MYIPYARTWLWATNFPWMSFIGQVTGRDEGLVASLLVVDFASAWKLKTLWETVA
jgi:hypothetical protein